MQGLSFGQIAAFGGTLYLGGLVLQYPIGWASDRVDRRALIMWLSGVGAVLMVVASFVPLPFSLVLSVALLLGGIINPLYSLLIALTNDYLSKEDMPGASAGLIFLNGFGAIFGPLVSGWFMAQIGAGGYFLFLGLLFAALAGYAAWRISRRSGPVEQASFTGLSPTASSLAVGAVMEQEPRTRRAS
jgi:MFS family permease